MNEKMNPDFETPSQKVDRLVKEAQKLFPLGEYYNVITPFVEELRKKHPDYDRYLCYHNLISSTPFDSDQVIEDDFEGEDSIIKFLEELIESRSAS